jgi:hypothetical protein
MPGRKIHNPWVKRLPHRTNGLGPAALLSLWPVIAMEGNRRQADRDVLAGMKKERVKCGEYKAEYEAYEILLGNDSGSGRITWKHHGHCPAAYRPILRVLNCRIVWALVALEVEPSMESLGVDGGKGKGKGKAIREPTPQTIEEEIGQLGERNSPGLARERYALWRDGHLRNLYYHTVVRRQFFQWLEKNYYNGKAASKNAPVTVPMLPLRCDILEAWWCIDTIIGSHNPDAIIPFRQDTQKMEKWNSFDDIFTQGMSIFLFLSS